MKKGSRVFPIKTYVCTAENRSLEIKILELEYADISTLLKPWLWLRLWCIRVLCSSMYCSFKAEHETSVKQVYWHSGSMHVNAKTGIQTVHLILSSRGFILPGVFLRGRITKRKTSRRSWILSIWQTHAREVGPLSTEGLAQLKTQRHSLPPLRPLRPLRLPCFQGYT